MGLTEEQIVQKYPSYFKGYKTQDSHVPLMWGFEISSGWLEIIDSLCEKIQSLNACNDFTIVQIKEKFGGLRVYCHYSNAEIESAIVDAEKEAMKTCEMCGTKENITTQGKRWIKTLCDVCRQKREAKYE